MPKELGKLILRIIGGTAVLLISFFGTLKIVDYWDTLPNEKTASSGPVFERWQSAFPVGDPANPLVKLRRDQAARIDTPTADCRAQPVYNGKITIIKGPITLGFRNQTHDIWNRSLETGYTGDLPRPDKISFCESNWNWFFIYAPSNDVEVKIEKFTGISFRQPSAEK